MNAETRSEVLRLIAADIDTIQHRLSELWGQAMGPNEDQRETTAYEHALAGIVVAGCEVEKAQRIALAISLGEQRDAEQCHHNGLQEGR